MDYRTANRNTVFYGVVFLAFCMGSHVFGSTHFLFSDEVSTQLSLDDGGVIPPPGDTGYLQSRPVRLNSAFATGEGLATGDQLVFALFDETAYTADIDRIDRNANGTVSIRGRITGYPLGTILMSTTGGRSLATIDIPEIGRQYVIRSSPDAAFHTLAAVDARMSDVLEDSVPLIPPASVYPERIPPPSDRSEPLSDPLDPVTFDVMIVYTPAAQTWANSNGGGIANVIAHAIEKGQLAMDNSKTFVSLRLASSVEINYTESGDSETDLMRLSNTSDGYMDQVGLWRNQYRADLVCLFASLDDTGGIAWLLDSPFGNPEHGYSLTRVQQAGNSYTFVHEMGHNLGCGHHKQQNSQPGPGLFDYSAGWRWLGTNGQRYCSVMTYDRGTYFADGQNSTTVSYFSNPAIDYQGIATGQTADGDNARTIREVKDAVVGYRDNTAPATPTILSPTAGAKGVSLTPTLRASNFFDADGDNHANSHWQIARDSSFANRVWDSQENYPASVEAAIPAQTLNATTTYFCRVRYKDNAGVWSEWSAAQSFTTRSFYSAGTGTELDPYQIAKAADWIVLSQTSQDWDKFFVVTADLNLDGITLSPVAADTDAATDGFQGFAFTGNLNGNRHVIRNAAIQAATRDYVGLFGKIGDGGQVRNLGVETVTLIGRKQVGGLAGWNERGILSSCYATGSVTGTESVGGLVGGNWIGVVNNCYSGGSVTGTQYVGGLVGGNLYYGKLNSCYASGKVTGQTLVGGLTGWDFRGFVTGCLWDIQASGQATSASGTGKTTAEMKTPETFTVEGWDLVGEAANGRVDIWRDCADAAGYPRLAWEFTKDGDFACPNGVAMEDLLYLAGRWMANTPETIGAADADGNGKVDLNDFVILAAEWMR